jgi:uncharacterized protein (TIGR02266 family)
MAEAEKHILIVDDEEDIRDLLEDILSEKGYRTSKAADGSEAIQFLANHRDVDLVISDVRMPEMNGVELLKNVREHSPDQPRFIFVTGYADISVSGAFEEGACGYIRKPFNWSDLIEKVEDSLREHPAFLRKHPRAKARLEVAMKFKSFQDSLQKTRTLNIGRGGMFLASTQFSKVGDIVEFEISFNEGELETIKGTGEIMWQRTEPEPSLPQGMGIRFIDLPDDVADKLDKFVNKNNIKAYIPEK